MVSTKRLYYIPANSYQGIEIQILDGEFGRFVYLGVNCREIPPLLDNPKCAAVVFRVNNQVYQTKGILLEGRQRILLGTQSANFLIESLKKGETIQITMANGFYEDVSAKNFPKFTPS